jgi:diaminopimelate epimerase
MNEINFTKLTAAGNDFVLIDKKLNPNFILNSELIKTLCDRRFGIGADGILTIDDSQNYDFEMGYYNSDGSDGMLCGNGARSIIKYAEHSGRIKNNKTQFLFSDEVFSGELLSKDRIKFNLNEPKNLQLNFNIDILEKSLNVSFIDTGAYHVVIDIVEFENEYENLEAVPVVKIGSEIRYSKHFNPPGTNVNFISIVDNIVKIRTFERGVEDETLACGTGSVASAMISYLNNKVSKPVKLKTKSGEILIVDFEYKDEKFNDVSLVGPAKIVFEGKYKIRGN